MRCGVEPSRFQEVARQDGGAGGERTARNPAVISDDRRTGSDLDTKAGARLPPPTIRLRRPSSLCARLGRSTERYVDVRKGMSTQGRSPRRRGDRGHAHQLAHALDLLSFDPNPPLALRSPLQIADRYAAAADFQFSDPTPTEPVVKSRDRNPKAEGCSGGSEQFVGHFRRLPRARKSKPHGLRHLRRESRSKLPMKFLVIIWAFDSNPVFPLIPKFPGFSRHNTRICNKIRHRP